MKTSPGDGSPDFPFKGLDDAPQEPSSRGPGPSKRAVRIAVAVVLLVLFALYAWMPPGHLKAFNVRAHHVDQYNLLTDGMLEGHLYLKETLPPGLLAMADPYDPRTNGEWRYKYGLWDQSFFEGHCYLYFGVTPVVTLYLPFRILSRGLRMSNPLATVTFAYLGLLFATGIFLSIRRRYFRELPVWMTASAVALLGTANIACYLISQSNIYQVAIACGMCFSLGSLYFLTRAFERTPHRTAYLLASGTFLALSVGSRPHFAVMTAVVLIVALVTLHRRGDLRMERLAAVAIPLGVGGLGLAFYNFFRFGSFFEFGAKYQLSIIDMRKTGMFAVDHVPSTLYFMFLQPPTFNKEYPYVHPMPKLPSWLEQPKIFLLERVTGVLFGAPFLWMLVFVTGYVLLHTWRTRGEKSPPARADASPTLEIAMLAGGAVVTTAVLSFTGGTMRYLADFASLLNLLAIIAWLYLDRSLLGSPKARLLARGVGLTLLLVSVVLGPAFALPPPRHYMDG